MSIRRASVACAAALLMFLGAAHATVTSSSFIQLFSQPGDTFGQGAQYRFTPADGNLQQSYDGSNGDVFVSFDSPSAGRWDFQFMNAFGAAMAVGDYTNIHSGPRDRQHTIMDLSGPRGCGFITGKFSVLEISFPSTGGPPDKLAIDFEQHCDGAMPTLFGAIRINSAIPYGRTSAPPLPSLGPVFLQIASELGEYVGQSEQKTITPADRAFNLYMNFMEGVTVVASGPSLTPWQLEFAPPSGQPFAAGTYENTQRYLFQSPGSPGMNVAGEGGGCNVVGGRFVVREWVAQTDTEWAKLAVDVEQHCEGAAPALYAGLRYNSAVPYTPPNLPPVATTISAQGSASFSMQQGDSASAPFAVKVLDNRGAAMAGVAVQFDSAPACGTFPGNAARATVSTDSSGVAVPPPWTAMLAGSDCVIFASVAQLSRIYTTFAVHITQPRPPPPTSSRQVTGASPAGGVITLALSSAQTSCSFTGADFIDAHATSVPVATLPAGLTLPQGLINFSVSGCGAGQSVTFTVDYPRPLPPGSSYWKYGPTMDNRTAHWYSVPARVDGSRMTFTIVDGGLGDDDLMANGSITDPGGVAVAGGLMQDLWWSGVAENGWGMSIIQHRDILFANMYVYDAQGNPTWYVMTSGTWNAAHTAFTGALFQPTAAPFFAYDVSRFNGGAPVGTATFTFSDANNAVFDYTINGVTGRKNITKILFGPADTTAKTPVSDLWWGGTAQNGWGLAVLQQYSTLFTLWYTYDSTGAPIWYVMSGGDWITGDTYSGRIYRTVGPAWLGVPYDVTRHHTIDVGSYSLHFSGDTASFNYTVDGRTGTLPLTRVPF